MAFRSLVLVSLLLLGSTAQPSAPGHAQERADAIMAAVNAALAKRGLLIVDGVPALK